MEWKSNPFFKSTFSPERHGSKHGDGNSMRSPSDVPESLYGNPNRINPTFEPWLEREEDLAAEAPAAEDKGTDASHAMGDGVQRRVMDGSEYRNGAAAAAAIGSDRPEEERFEQTVRRMVTHEISVSDGIKAFREICCARAEALRDLASSQVEQTPQYHALMRDADDLECEGSTWNLLWYLFAIEDAAFPAGKGGDFVHGAGMYKTMRQHAADAVFQDPELNRAGRVVAWLEAEAREKDMEPEHGIGRKDGLWRETKSVLDGTATSRFGQQATGLASVKHLDPDAMTREHGRINGDNAKDEERLSKVLWRLLRSGRLYQAAHVCDFAGQPWRAASLTGYGMYGPLPLGEAADEADSYETGLQQSETLAVEIELGASSKMLWRWSCHAAARKIAESVSNAGHGTYEAALYGVLSGDVEKAIPACTSWQDLLWTHTRCWLEYQIDMTLLEKSQAALGAVHGTQGVENEATMDAVYESLTDAGVSVPSSQWPIEAVSRQIAQDLTGAISQGSTDIAGNKTSNYRNIQVDLMLARVESLLERLIAWIVPGGATEEAQHCPPGLMRFSAHLSLLLWSLNLVEMDGEGISPLYSKINDGLQKLLWIYVIHLIDSGSYLLVPGYVVHLRLGLRRTTTHLLLEQATYHESISDRKRLHVLCRQWFEKYNDVEGFAQDEMWVSVSQFCTNSRDSSFGGPRMRAECVSWMFFDEKYIDIAIQQSVILCRDFALGKLQGAVAGLVLLKEVIPHAADCTDGLSSLLSRTGTSGYMRELASWEKYFEIVREYSLWEEVYTRVVRDVLESDDTESSQQALQGLMNDTKYLFDGILEFILVEGGEWVQSSDDNLLEATLVLAPAEDPLSADADAYPAFQEDTVIGVCESVDEFVKSQITDQISFETGTGGVDMPGLIFIKMWADTPQREVFDTTATHIFSSLLKNGITHDNATVTFVASNIFGTVSSNVCQAICLPQLVLHVATLREALAYMGVSATLEDADAVIEKGKQGWDGLFNEAQKNELASLEKSGTELLTET